MRVHRFFCSHSSRLLAFVVWAGVTMLADPLSAELAPLSQETFCVRSKPRSVSWRTPRISARRRNPGKSSSEEPAFTCKMAT